MPRNVELMEIHKTLSFCKRIKALKSGCLPFRSWYSTFALEEKVLKSILFLFKACKALTASTVLNELSFFKGTVVTTVVSFLLIAVCNFLVEWQPVAAYNKKVPVKILKSL